MYCKKCGAENDDNAYKCVNCGEVLQQGMSVTTPTQSVPTYLVQSILVTLFCCLPLGIAAIVFAAQVNGKLQAGDIEGAMESSRKAKMWCWWSFGIGIAWTIAVFAFYTIVGIAGGLSNY